MMKRRAVSPANTSSSAAKKLKCPEDLDRIVPDLSAASTLEVPRNGIELDKLKYPRYGDPVDRLKIRKAGK